MKRIQRAPHVPLFLAAVMMMALAVATAAPASAKHRFRIDDSGWKADDRRPGTFIDDESTLSSHLSFQESVSLRDDTVPDFETIHFELDQDELKPEYDGEVDRMGQTLALHPEWSVEIQGHADDTGTAAYNDDLSRRRARTVYRHLASRYPGIADQLRIRAFGEAEPVRTNHTSVDRARNRRVEFLVFSRRP